MENIKSLLVKKVIVPILIGAGLAGCATAPTPAAGGSEPRQ